VKIAALLVALLISAGCTSQRSISVPRVPDWIPAKAVTVSEVIARSRQLVHVSPQLSDGAFTTVSREWLDLALPWSWEFAIATGLAYVPESFDCDKFAKAFSLSAEISAARAGVKAQPLVARIYVMQVKAWGGIPIGGAHALIAVATDAGVIIVEPQTRATISLDEYPNRDHIFAVKIGG
jgi:hypothetical protein